jgi:hypothetical protein
MADFYCAYCGKYGDGRVGQGPVSTPSRPNGWLQNKSWGFGIKYYCSKKCKLADEGVISASEQNKASSSPSYSNSPVQKTAEQIRAEHEVEMEKERIRKETEAQEAAERKIKAQKYKDKGWPFIAWLIEINPIFTFCLFGYPFMFLLGPDVLKLIGIISLFVLISLLIKDVARMSWKGFSLILLLFFGLLIGFIMFIHKSNNENNELIDAELEQMEKSANDEVNQATKEIEQGIDNKTEDVEFIEVQDNITIEGIAEKVYFYNKPNNDSKTKGYFVKGQQAKLLGTAGEFSKVRFELNGKVTEKFVLTNQISEIDTYVPTEPDTEEGLDPEYKEN